MEGILKNFIKLFFLLSISVFLISCGTDDDDCLSNDDCGEGFECNIDTGECEPKEGGDGAAEIKDEGSSSTDDQDEKNDQDVFEKTDDGGIYVQCTPGDTKECYEGPSGSSGIGICSKGIATCVVDGTDWSECVGQVLPEAEICGDGIDQDCNGEDATAETVIDIDGDGFTYCTGDCCETTWECTTPERVGPGSFEVPSNGIDDNCNGTVDEESSGCDVGLNADSSDPLDLGKAIDLCLAENESEYGLVSARIVFPNGNEMSDPYSGPDGNGGTTNNPSIAVPGSAYSILPGMGNFVKPTQGTNFLILSTGQAKTKIDNLDTDNLTESSAPEDWYLFHDSKFPDSPNCGLLAESPGENPVRDSVMLELVVRAPNNAAAFSIDINFHSAEFPEYVCKGFNDFFVMLLDSTFTSTDMNLQNPADKNLAMDENKNSVGINLAKSGLFKVCKNKVFPPTNFPGCLDDTELQGTGFEGHGATGWLVSRGNIVPGEEFKIRMAIWDTGDHIYDSLVVLDNFKWYESAQKPGTGEK